MNQDLPDMNDDLLVKHLLGEASPDEEQMVQQWITVSEANRHHYDQLKLIWDESKKLAATSNIDTDKAWRQFKERVAQKQDVVTKPKTISLFAGRWVRIAAMLVLVVGGSLLYYINNSNKLIVVQSAENTLTDTLPDGSVVILNKHSSISYRRGFGSDTRKVALTGEAFFSVIHNDKKPFIVSAGEANIKDVGTSFNIKNTPDETEIIVETGVVEVAKKKYAITVLPHEKAVVSRGQEKPVKQSNADELYNYYRTHEFVCNGTPLWKLVNVLNDAYSVNIIITSQQVKNMQLTTTFQNEPLNSILAVICETFNLHVERQGNDIYLNQVPNG